MQLQFSHPSISDSEFVERIEQKKASFYRVAFGYTRNEDDALEVVQEAVCKAYTAKWCIRGRYILLWYVCDNQCEQLYRI